MPEAALDTVSFESASPLREARIRPVQCYKVHAGARPLAERIAELLPEDVDHVVFDLDRTVHLGVTIGEQLGWYPDQRKMENVIVDYAKEGQVDT